MKLKTAEEWKKLWLADKTEKITLEDFEVKLSKRIEAIQIDALRYAAEVATANHCGSTFQPCYHVDCTTRREIRDSFLFTITKLEKGEPII
jgi:hypothetical protein